LVGRKRITLTTQVALLAELQRVDQNLKSNSEAVETRRSALEQLDAQIAAQRQQVATAEADLAALERRQRELDAQLTDAESKMKDRRMRIARIRNDKELGLVRREIDALKEVTNAAETELLQLMEQGDQRRTAVDAARQALAAMETARAGEAEELEATISRVSGAIEEDRSRRDSLLATVDADLHRRYELIFSRRGGVAVVRVRGGACQGCHMNVPPQLFNQIKRNEQVFLCPSCQRILFFDPQDDEPKA
jgi:predicted  nucleic acid-binding Zn-ribbon protein